MKKAARPCIHCWAEKLPWVGPVGRLDKASEGLLLLTNDSEWAARVSDPASHLDKIYHVQAGALAREALTDQLVRGVLAGGELLRAKHAHVLRTGEKNAWLEIVLDEGKNRQIRRMLEASRYRSPTADSRGDRSARSGTTRQRKVPRPLGGGKIGTGPGHENVRAKNRTVILKRIARRNSERKNYEAGLCSPANQAASKGRNQQK